MAIRVVRLGSPRARGEGLRLGTVRRPPRGVPKSEYATRDFYDVWLPDLAPWEALLKQGRGATDERAWRAFVRRFLANNAAAVALGFLATMKEFPPSQKPGSWDLDGIMRSMQTNSSQPSK